MPCTYLGREPMRCTLKSGGVEQYENNKEICESDKFSKCPWIKQCLSKEEYMRFSMMWGFFK